MLFVLAPQYAFRFVQRPIGIFGVEIGVAAMPLLARHSVNKNTTELKNTFVSAQTMVFVSQFLQLLGFVFWPKQSSSLFSKELHLPNQILL
jgi:peptidoglycan biosynthesis protein MviN/MurJ (putative lipid II flippase)